MRYAFPGLWVEIAQKGACLGFVMAQGAGDMVIAEGEKNSGMNVDGGGGEVVDRKKVDLVGSKVTKKVFPFACLFGGNEH